MVQGFVPSSSNCNPKVVWSCHGTRWTRQAASRLQQGHRKAYVAETYLQGKTADEQNITKLVMSKSRVAPIKRFTLLRLQLTGALIAARMASYLLNMLNMQVQHQNGNSLWQTVVEIQSLKT